ncbi:hypothetical protein FHETE_9260 [Fusarium heterosporum]|uniref:Uncharacterized protein n=1 Tax=Fusarium heterosporum TaxID=42747 RepID=A0A8H5STV7_FUSHE|nr:hypothetical protein FHETE_9260 [Fusarium heterosporum]
MASQVTFQKNVVGSKKLAGGYTTWQLIPAGPRVNVGEDSKDITGQFTNLQCANQEGKIDKYAPNKDHDFQPGEPIQLSGPDASNTVTFSGKLSGDSVWALVLEK